MARNEYKTVIESLEQIALVEATSDASTRAIARARQAVLQQAPVKRRRPAMMTFVAIGCAAAIALLLVPVWNHFQHGERKPAAHGPVAAGPSARGRGKRQWSCAMACSTSSIPVTSVTSCTRRARPTRWS